MRQGPSPSPSERRRAFGQHLKVWMGLLCLCAQLATVFHLALVEHVTCLEHGELVHADAEEHHHGSNARSTHEESAHKSSPAGPLASSTEEDHAHDVCLICTDRRNLALFASEHLAPQLSAPKFRELQSERSSSTKSQSRVHQYAPKTSPPV